jgi:nitric oxide synthase oxygenase domain/subunit/ferredoxin-NADP reductase/CRP-like cAMP-binding protein
MPSPSLPATLSAADRAVVGAAFREVFRDTDVRAVEGALASAVVREFDEGAVLLAEGSAADDVLVLCAGRVHIYARNAEGALVGVATVATPGALLGEQALAAGRQFRNATALALVPTRVAAVPGDAFRLLLAGDERARTVLADRGADQSLGRLQALARELGSLTGERPAVLPTALQLAPGAVLFGPGESAGSAFFVLSGQVGLFHPGCPVPHESIGPGLLFGEREVLEARPRTLRAVAFGPTEVLVVDGSVLRSGRQGGGALGTMLEGLAYVHAMPQFGSAYRYLGQVDGESCFVTDYQQASGLRIRVRQFPRQRRAEAGRVEALSSSADSFSSPDGEISLRLAADGAVLGLAAPQTWPRLPEVMALLLRGGRLEAWQREAFRSSGDLLLEDAAFRAAGGQEVICGCTNTSSSALRLAARGAGGVDDLVRLTGAGGVCGGCRGRLPAFLGQAEFSLCRLGTQPLAEGSVAAQLRPIHPAVLPPARPGQHVRLEALIDDRWVGRPYTLTASSREVYELGVKLEQDGLFSQWIHQAPAGALVRVFVPEGVLCPSGDDPRALVYVVAGIGVTPAIAAVRAGWHRQMTVVYSFRGAAAAAYLGELRAAAGAGRIRLLEHDTSRGARLGEGDLAALVAPLGSAEVIACGPAGFNAAVAAALARLPGVTVSAESFEHPQRGERGVAEPGSWRLWEFRPRCPAGPPVEVGTTLSAAAQAEQFLREFHLESRPDTDPAARLAEVRAALAAEGCWEKTFDELAFAARVAWRNAERCVGRLYWQGLHLRDCRRLRDPAEMAEALWEHLRFAHNGGDLRPAITIFAPGSERAPGPRIWNPQLMRYAGYRLRSGKQVGDPAQNELTRRIIALGWKPPGTDFDLLPIVIETTEHGPRWFELPPDCRWEVPIFHPQHPWLAAMNLKWYPVPAVADMALDAGGMMYRMAPFNGWYLNTEIAARNFTDANRYHLLPRVAERMGLDIGNDRSLWRDKALLMLSEAVLQSFDRAGVRMADHHHVGHEFLEFCRNEQKAGREPHGNWAWLVPPVSGSTSVLYQEPFRDQACKPAYVAQEPVWKERPAPAGGAGPAAGAGCPFH